jgi:hypothetical protein
MSYFDDASLVMIPSGYKDQKVYSVKPIDGSGDLTFTRSIDTATRVGPDGLIEKVRTNLALRSQSFATSAVWSTVNGTITDNAGTAPDGTNTASKIVATDADPFVYQTLTLSGQVAVSCYVKGIGSSIGKSGSIRAASAITNFSITGDWQRVVVVHNAGGAQTYGVETPEAASVSDEVLLWGFQVETGDIATDYIATTSAAVSVGPVANLPRLDYSGGATCPKLLLEPQRVNLAQFSESFNNAYWTQNATVTANSTISPSGYQDADTLTDASNSYLDVRRSFTITASTAYTFSTFVKKTTGTLTNYAGIGFSGGGGVETGYAIFNTTTGVVNLADIAGGFVLSAKSTSYGDYYRFEMTFTTGQTSLLVLIYPALSQNGTTLSSDAQGSNVFWGAQLEAGAYATSYIPTLGAVLTRGADSASKTSATALIGQTEGTVFLEVDYSTLSGLSMFMSIRPTASTKVEIYRDGGTIYADLTASSSFALSASEAVGTHKIAFAYKSGSSALYIDGVLAGQSTTSFTFSDTLSNLFINQRSGGTFIEAANYKQVLLFTTRLSNDSLAALTA